MWTFITRVLSHFRAKKCSIALCMIEKFTAGKPKKCHFVFSTIPFGFAVLWKQTNWLVLIYIPFHFLPLPLLPPWSRSTLGYNMLFVKFIPCIAIEPTIIVSSTSSFFPLLNHSCRNLVQDMRIESGAKGAHIPKAQKNVLYDADMHLWGSFLVLSFNKNYMHIGKISKDINVKGPVERVFRRFRSAFIFFLSAEMKKKKHFE